MAGFWVRLKQNVVLLTSDDDDDPRGWSSQLGRGDIPFLTGFHILCLSEYSVNPVTMMTIDSTRGWLPAPWGAQLMDTSGTSPDQRRPGRVATAVLGGFSRLYYPSVGCGRFSSMD